MHSGNIDLCLTLSQRLLTHTAYTCLASVLTGLVRCRPVPAEALLLGRRHDIHTTTDSMRDTRNKPTTHASLARDTDDGLG